METGIELIAKERQEQIEKHGYTNDFTEKHSEYYSDCQLARVAGLLTHKENFGDKMHPMELAIDMHLIENWDEGLLIYMASKPYKERLIVAGALIAAELDRVNGQMDA